MPYKNLKLIGFTMLFLVFTIVISIFNNFIAAAPDTYYYDFIPVITYHHIVETKEECINNVIVTAEEFENHLATFVEEGYETIFLDDLYSILKFHKKFDRKYLVITFDDGYLSNYVYAYPLLKKYGLNANISVVSTYIGAVESPMPMLGWNEITEMEDSGHIRFYSHGYEHKDYSKLPVSDALSELLKAEELLDANLKSHYNKIITYPHGGFDRYLNRKLRQNDFVMLVSTKRGIVTKNTSLCNIPRVNVDPGLDGNGVLEKIENTRVNNQ